MNGFSTRIAKTLTSDFRHFKLVEDIEYYAVDGTHYRLCRGTTSDLASIPRFLWALLPPQGEDGAEYGLAAWLHDQAYKYKLCVVNSDGSCTPVNLTREQCDLLLKEAMLECDVPTRIVDEIYLGVRAGGEPAYISDRS